MKITVDVDCTPEEARTFLGLPDVRPMQEAVMRDVQERVSATMRAMEPEEMMRLWLPASIKGMEQFFEAMTRMGGMKRE